MRQLLSCAIFVSVNAGVPSSLLWRMPKQILISSFYGKGATFLTHNGFHVFYNCNPIAMFPCAPFSDIQALKHEFQNLYLLSCHHTWFTSLFCVSDKLSINVTTSFQFWIKLLFFLRKETYLVLAKQIWIPYEKKKSFVEFPYEGKKLAAYAEEMPTTIYLHMKL